MLGLRPDPDDVVQLHDLGETGILREEAVAGMDRVGMADLSGRNDVRDVEIGLVRRRRADANRLVREPDVHGVGVGGGVNRDRLDAHFVASAVDAKRYFAPVGDQDLLDGHFRITQ